MTPLELILVVWAGIAAVWLMCWLIRSFREGGNLDG